MTDPKMMIARNVKPLLKKGDLVNLGAGIPYLLTGLIREEDEIGIQAECGTIGAGPKAQPGEEILTLIAPDTSFGTLKPEGYCFDSQVSFGMIRGGYLDVTVLGALQVDCTGSMANWDIPGKGLKGMGGAMDLATGAKTVIVAMEHCTKDGQPKILKQCTFPLTCKNQVNYIVTELCILEVTSEGLLVKALAPGVTREEVQSRTEAELIFPEQIGIMVE